MGFEMENDFYMNTSKDPKMKIYKKKEADENKKQTSYYYIEEKNRSIKRFKTFNDVIEYFDHYEQPDFDKNA